MGSRFMTLWLAAILAIEVAMVSGCTRERPPDTPTPTSAVDEVLSTPSPTPAPTATPVPPEPTYHTVRPGDTVWAIAAQYGVSVEDLVAANQLSDADSLKPGQQLIIPDDSDDAAAPELGRDGTATPAGEPEGRTTHVVADGDTLWSIALQYETSVDEIAALNGLDPEALLSLGQPVLIP